MSEVFNSSVLDAINRAVQDGISTTALEVDGTPQYCIINAETREIEIPGELNIFGVESDEKSTRVYFRCPKYVGTNVDLDMTQCMVYVPYRNANGEKDQYIVTDLNETENGENVEFTWLISRKASAYMGITEFGIRAIKTATGGTIEAEWNTTVASANVIRGMDVGLLEFSEENKDAIAQAVDLVKQEIELKGQETLATIPDDYTTVAQNALSAKNEVEDIRVGADGKTYRSAGEAVRGQIDKTIMIRDAQVTIDEYPTIAHMIKPGIYGVPDPINFPDLPPGSISTSATIIVVPFYATDYFIAQYYCSEDNMTDVYMRVINFRDSTIYANWKKFNEDLELELNSKVCFWKDYLSTKSDSSLAKYVTPGIYGSPTSLPFTDYPEDFGELDKSIFLKVEGSFYDDMVRQYLYISDDPLTYWSRDVVVSTHAIYNNWQKFDPASEHQLATLPKVAFCGDSFTSTNYVGTPQESISYVTYLNNMGVCDGTNYGISGSTPETWFLAHAEDITNKFDIYFLAFGLNDDSEGDGNPDSENPKTFGGGMNQIINKIQTIAPGARIIIWCMDAWYSETKSDICKEISEKKGCEYYSMKADRNIPLRINGKYNGVMDSLSYDVIEKKDSIYKVSSSNAHPNSFAQKMLATFLKTIL